MKHLSLVVVMILLAGCMQVKDETSNTLKLLDYADMGETHNSFLDNALEKYDSSLTKRLVEVNLTHLRTLGMAPERLAEMEGRVAAERYLLPPDEFAHRAFYRKGLPNARVAQGEGTVFESLALLRKSGAIGSFSHELLMNCPTYHA